MTKSKHTPGPWIVLTQGTGVSIAHEEKHPDRVGGHRIARMHSGKRSIHADARLIAAAPDLLEALEDAVAVMARNITPKPDVHDDHPWSKLVKARAAIAKAKGEE